MGQIHGISIIIPTYNNLDSTKICIGSILKYTAPPYEIIVVDNHSTDGTIPWLKTLGYVKLILNDNNKGLPTAYNQGAEIADINNDIALLHNDVYVTKNWLENMHLALHSDINIGAVSCVTSTALYSQSIETNYNNLAQMQAFAEEFNRSNPGSWEKRVVLVDYCTLINRSAINKIGLLDEIFTPGNFEWDDYSYRLNLAGYKLLLCKDTFVHHENSSMFNEAYTPSEQASILCGGRQKFINKWGFATAYSKAIRLDLIQFIENSNKKPSNVLEVGCGCGATLLKIKDLYKDVSLYGIEINPMPAKIASGFSHVYTGDVETMQFGYPDNYFDCIIFGDVLEHLRDPWGLLQRIKKHLSPDGVILASLPNIMHFSILLGLINGSWQYTDAGILDKTHLRFFTLEGIISLFHESGYKISNIKAIDTKINDQRTEDLIKHLTLISSPDKASQYKVFQYLIEAGKS